MNSNSGQNLTFIRTGIVLLSSVIVLFPPTCRVFSMRDRIIENQSGLGGFLVASFKFPVIHHVVVFSFITNIYLHVSLY